MLRRKRKFVLYPEYFDSKLSRSEGRRIPINVAVSEPTLKKIMTAAKYLELNPEAQEDKAYPKRWWEPRGRILVDKKEGWSKQKTIIEVAKIARRLKKKTDTSKTKVKTKKKASTISSQKKASSKKGEKRK